MSERARLLAIARRLLDALPGPGAARELALELVRELEHSDEGLSVAGSGR